MTRPIKNPENVFDIDLSRVGVPVLVVTDIGDACPKSPPGITPRPLSDLWGKPETGHMGFGGGPSGSGLSRGGLSPHGYLGIETEAVAGIGDWICARTATWMGRDPGSRR